MKNVEVRATVANQFGLYANETASFTVEDDNNAPHLPVIDSLIVSPESGPPGTRFTFTINTRDENVPPSFVQSVALKISIDGAPFRDVEYLHGNVYYWDSF